MNSRKQKRATLLRTLAAAWLPLVAMYVIWCVVSHLIDRVGGLFAGNPHYPVMVLPLSILASIVLALFISQLFMVYVNDGLDEIPAIRGLMLLASVGLGCMIYWVMRDGTVKGGWLESLGTANLIVFACLTATWMTHPLTRPSELVPVCVVVALADLFSVFAGPTKQLVEGISAYYEQGMQGPPPLADFILVKINVPGYGAAMPLFGVSDWIILVFLTAVLTKFGLSDNLTGAGIYGMKKRKRISLFVPAASIGLMIALISAQVSGLFLPALPFVVVAFMAYALVRYPQVRDLKKQEWVLLTGFSTIMIALLTVGLFLNGVKP